MKSQRNVTMVSYPLLSSANPRWPGVSRAAGPGETRCVLLPQCPIVPSIGIAPMAEISEFLLLQSYARNLQATALPWESIHVFHPGK